MDNPAIEIRPIEDADRDFLRAEMIKHWITPLIWSRGVQHQADALPGFIAWRDGERVGHVTIATGEGECEVVTLASVVEGRGAGTALLSAAVEFARRAGARRVFLTTTNDNLRALGFYQRRGWRIAAVYPGMIDRYREQLKEIPRMGMNGIPLNDEIELELALA